MTLDDATSFEDLLGLTQDDVPATQVPEKKTRTRAPRKDPAKETPLVDRISELEAQLAQPEPTYADEDDVESDDPVVVAQQARIKELEDQLARRSARHVENAPTAYVSSRGSGDLLLIHFEEDGFVAFGQTWYRGQELEIVRNGPEHERTKDRNGASWIDLVDDRRAQITRWGKVMFESGPFVPRPGERFTDAVATEDKRRGRAVPMIIGQ